ncbi:MAG: T9SS type A sorting domain-containing protein [Lentimicrobium sp.]|nr:T9SS type A sorting domain-containing protein [Lentimicrobium sp.]
MRLSGITLVLLIFTLLQIDSCAQNTGGFGIEFWNNPEVVVGNKILLNAWTGGLNNVQMGKIDLNGDDYEDLVVFDRHGDRLLTFIYVPLSDSGYYKYAPEFRRFFPSIKQWFQLHDYNNDGLMDIFTYTSGGILVYKNTGTINPQFVKVVDPYITSLQGAIYTNLLVTYVDYPSIFDLDGDGDLDILTFWGLGSYIDLHKNMSMELYGNSDSLVFQKIEGCWGRIAENPESNLIYLDTCYRNLKSDDYPKHTGSTFCLLDIDGDGIEDLLLGDVDYSEPAILINGGDNINAFMTSQLDSYPALEPINLSTFPLVQLINIDHSGKNSLLASPFDPSLVKSEGNESVWLYSDVSESQTPDFRLSTKSFLQNTMIDAGLGAYPVFADVNQDGLTDMILGNYGDFDTCVINNNGQLKCYYTGRLRLFINIGSSFEPSFNLVDDDFAGISALGLRGVYPAFCDLDGNGSLDMLLGNEDGKLLYFRNNASPGQMPEYEQPVTDFMSVDVGGNSTPVFVNFQVDELPYLVIGNTSGTLHLYRNSGTAANPLFDLESEQFGKINVTDFQVSYTGHSVPCFYADVDGTMNLLVGSESGRLFHYGNVSNNPDASFELLSEHFLYVSEGIRTAPAISDLNSDGFPDLAVGNYSGGVTLFRGTMPGSNNVGSIDNINNITSIYPNPAREIFEIKFNFSADWNIRLFDIQGRLIIQMESKNVNGMVINSENLNPGLYYLHATDFNNSGAVASGKILITR